MDREAENKSKKITELGFVTTDLQELNTRQIEALQNSTERQIAALQDTNAKQITALQELTEKQIEALHKTTYEQISSFEQQIGVVTTKVSDSSILLAEILGRELEKSIDLFTNRVHMEEAKYKNLSEWKLLRTDVEKRAQLTNQWTRIQNIKRGLDYLVDKYNKVKEFLVSGQSK